MLIGTLLLLLVLAGIIASYYGQYLESTLIEQVQADDTSPTQDFILPSEEVFIYSEPTDTQSLDDYSMWSSQQAEDIFHLQPQNHENPDISYSENRNLNESILSNEASTIPPPPRYAPLRGRPIYQASIELPWYHFRFSYQDIMENTYLWEWLLRKADIDESIRQYGLPKDFFQRSFSSEEIQRLLRQGMFRYDKDGYICTDYNTVLRYYHRYTLPLYQLLRTKLGAEASLYDYIEELLRFCQDIPYERPGEYYADKYIWDFYPPPHIMLERVADCDSKCVLFASILMHDSRFQDKIVYITVSGHLLLGIEGEPNPYQEWVSYAGKKYIFCDPVGPAHIAFGVSAWDYGPILNIEKASLR